MIEWRDSLSVGIPQIDEDHKHLIGITNEYLTMSKTDPDPVRLKEIADRLLEYAYRHFECEERLQLVAHYPDYDDHKRQHDALVNALEGFIERYFVDKREPIDDLTTHEMQAFLRTWLIDHILKTDMKMKGKLG